ncbi:AMP-binding protein [Nocardiopsis terrae]
MSDPAPLLRDWIATYDTPTTTVAHLLCDRHDPHTIATTEIGPTLEPTILTFGELRERSQTLAAGLAAQGITPGDRIATLIPKGVDLTITALATWRLGAVLVPLLSSFAPSAIAERLTDSGARIVICADEHRTKLDPSPHLPTHPTWQIATTGTHPLREGDHTLHTLSQHPPHTTNHTTTGNGDIATVYVSNLIGPPRGVRVPARALTAMHAYHHLGLGVQDDDVYWNTADPGSAYGLYHGLISPLLAGHNSLALRAGFFDPELTLDVLGLYQVTNFASDPTTYRTLRAATKTLPPEIIVQRMASAGEPLAPDVIEWATDLFGVPIRDHYGQTELGWCAGIPNNPDLPEHNTPLPPAAIGPALPGWNIQVLEAITDEPAPLGAYGRIAIDRTHSPLDWFDGYHGYENTIDIRFNPERTYHLTGDTGIMDRQGNLHFSTRDDGAIITRSYRIGPTEVEAVLNTHPAVEECGVYAIPDDIAGHLVGARIVLTDDHTGTPELAEELRDWVSTRFAPHAAPHTVNFVEELPRTASGKMRRARLR